MPTSAPTHEPVPPRPGERAFDRRYAAVRSRDRRFDGRFVTAVRSTGIYCRPSCPARTPLPRNVTFYATAAAAQEAGYRACRRCRPEAAPGSPDWDARADAVGRAVRLIEEGVVDRDGVAGLAGRLGYSPRHLHRLLVDELGAGPLALARAHRARTAALLIESGDLRLTDVAFAAGFGSLRQFNDTIRRVFGRTPTELRGEAGRRPLPAAAGAVELRLRRREPFAWPALLTFLERRAVPGLEEVVGASYRRALRLPRGAGRCELSDDGDAVRCRLWLEDLRDLAAAVARCRRLLDLDADPLAVDGRLGEDPVLARLVDATPGRRLPGTVDGYELAVRTVVGQQVSVAGARTILGRLVAAHGAPVGEDAPGVPALRGFPAPEVVAALPDEALPMPRRRAAALRGLARAVADGALVLDGGEERGRVRERLLALPGIGPWTVEYLAARGLGDPDAIPVTDLGLRAAARDLGLPEGGAGLAIRAARWAPWRAYAAQHLWASLEPRPVPTPEHQR
jgi:AraC family transcriptional regulator of adaptative response / DNA-3-methyladenine glycosylase II